MRRVLGLFLCFVLMLPIVAVGAVAEEDINMSAILITGYECFEGAINEYCELHPNVHVDVQIMDTDSYLVLIKTKLASNDAPDIMPIEAATDYYNYYSNGYLVDCSDMTDMIDRLNAGAISGFTVEDGGVIGLPFVQLFLLAYYNKDMFAEYGLEVPTTWEELMAVCETLKQNGITPIGLGHKTTWVTQMLPFSLNATTVWDADPEFYKGTASGASKYAESAGWLDSLTKYREIIDAGYINEGSLSTSSEQMHEMLMNREVGMIFTGTWDDSAIYALNPDFELGGFLIPASGGSTGASVSINSGYGVSSSSKYPEVAKDVIRFMLSKESLEKYCPSFISCYSDVVAELSPAVQEAAAQLPGKTGYAFDSTFFAPGVQDSMFAGLQELIAGNMTPMEVLEDMDAATAKANK